MIAYTGAMSIAEDQLAGLIARYDAAVAALGTAAIDLLGTRYPGAFRLVYDNYNALVVAFSPTLRPSDAVLSIALYPRWVTLFLAHGALLADPHHLLMGDGVRVRSRRLPDRAELQRGDVAALVDAAWADTPLQPGGGTLTIRAIVAKQRPRRPE
jgi:hypothetical protein